MRRRGLQQQDAAAHFAWDETYISKLATGRQVPGLPNAIRIERETGIPVEAWVASEVTISKSVESPETVQQSVEQGGKRNA